MPFSTSSVMRRADLAAAPISSKAPPLSSLSAAARRVDTSSLMDLRAPAPSANIRLISWGSCEASAWPGPSGGASGKPIVISTILSPRSPWVEMRASEFRRMRSWKRRATVMVTRTLPPGCGGRITLVTRPICTPARRTVAPSINPPTSVNSATRSYLLSKYRARAPSR